MFIFVRSRLDCKLKPLLLVKDTCPDTRVLCVRLRVLDNNSTLPEPSVEAIALIPYPFSVGLALTAVTKFAAPVFRVVLPAAVMLTPSISIISDPLVLAIVSSFAAVPLPTVIFVGVEAAPALLRFTSTVVIG